MKTKNMTEKAFQITLHFSCQMFAGVVNGVKTYIFF